MMYEFASLRGDNFKSEAGTPEEAWLIICEREKDEGTLWRAFDQFLVESCIQKGWKTIFSDGMLVAYREVI